MKASFGVIYKLIVCSLLFLTGTASMAGIDSQAYLQADAEKGRQPLMQEMLEWVGQLVPFDSSHLPSFRWIETTPVKDDPRLQQAATDKEAKMLADISNLGKLQRVVAPGGMFRRVENAPASAFKGDFSQVLGRGGLIAQEPNLSLSANVAAGLRVADADVNWFIRSLNGGQSRQLSGHSLQLSLPPGEHEILLRIGTYEERAVVGIVPGRLVKPDFVAKVGRLRVSSNQPADWQVVAHDGMGAGRKLLTHSGSDQIDAIVPAGEYDVVATVNSASQTQRVKVTQGGVSVAGIQIPTGKVNLVATLGNSPAMRPMRWTLYRLDGGRQEIASPQRHSAILVVSPGHYEAVANLDGRERRREFTVLNGSSNNIVLAMD